MDIIKELVEKYRAQRWEDLLLIRVNNKSPGFKLALIDQRNHAEPEKLESIKHTEKILKSHPDVIGGIVIVNQVRLLMNSGVQTSAIYANADKAAPLVAAAIKHLKKVILTKTQMAKCKATFCSFINSNKDEEIICNKSKSAPRRFSKKRRYGSKSLGESPDVFIMPDKNKFRREEIDFEGHQEWNLE